MGGGGAWTTCSSSGWGGRSSTRTSTGGATRRCRSCNRDWGATSGITTRSGCIRPWITEHQRPCIGRDERAEGRWGEGEAVLFTRHSLSPGEGSAVRTRLPWGRAEEQRRGRAEFSRTVAKEGTFLV